MVAGMAAAAMVVVATEVVAEATTASAAAAALQVAEWAASAVRRRGPIPTERPLHELIVAVPAAAPSSHSRAATLGGACCRTSGCGCCSTG